MIKHVDEAKTRRFLLLTECSVRDNIATAHPEKEMLRLCGVRCPHMAEITMEDTLKAMQNHQYVVELPKDIRFRARQAVERMIAIG